jgi:hypothetical protein
MKRVAILGFAPSHVEAPFGDPSIAIWTMNFHHEQVARTDAIFDLHDWAVIAGEDGGAHVQSLAAATCPVWMQAAHPEVPTSRAYPLAQMKARYTLPHADLPYFTNTASYMVALAIEDGYEEIQLFGVDMAADTEYGSQRPSCEFFLGVAVGKGIRVVPHRLSDILKTAFLYGYEDQRRDWFREKLVARRTHLTQMKAHHVNLLEQQKAAVSEFNGAIQDTEHILKTWT